MMKHLSTGPVFYDPFHDQKRRPYNGENHYARAPVQYRNSLYYGSYGVPGMAQAVHIHAPLTNTYYDAPGDMQRLSNANIPPKARQRPQHTGGVALEVDYELEEMAEFVGIHACMLAKQAPQPSPAFRKFIAQILASTRLPLATVLLALYYLKHRLGLPLPVRVQSRTLLSPEALYRYLTVAFLLANKFLDDNTFTNKSWSDVTNIDVCVINELEKKWLQDIAWHLQLDDAGKSSWEGWESRYYEFISEKALPCYNAARTSVSPYSPCSVWNSPRSPHQQQGLAHQILPVPTGKGWNSMNLYEKLVPAYSSYPAKSGIAWSQNPWSLPPLGDLRNWRNFSHSPAACCCHECNYAVAVAG